MRIRTSCSGSPRSLEQVEGRPSARRSCRPHRAGKCRSPPSRGRLASAGSSEGRRSRPRQSPGGTPPACRGTSCHALEVRDERGFAVSDHRIVLCVGRANVFGDGFSWLTLVEHEVVERRHGSLVSAASLKGAALAGLNLPSRTSSLAEGTSMYSAIPPSRPSPPPKPSIWAQFSQ